MDPEAGAAAASDSLDAGRKETSRPDVPGATRPAGARRSSRASCAKLEREQRNPRAATASRADFIARYLPSISVFRAPQGKPKKPPECVQAPCREKPGS